MQEGQGPMPRLGLAVPVFSAPGQPAIRTPSVERLDWSDVRRAIVLADELGLDSLWFSDHLFHGRDGDFLESWTTLAAAAGMTDRIRLVTNHLGLRLRPAPLLAKMAATADVISSGRLELFLSHGLRAREHTAYGYPWEPDARARLELVPEAIRILRSLWSAEPVDHSGPAYRLSGALSSPAPAHRIPIWLGGPLDGDAGNAAVELIAREADGWNALPSTLERYAEDAARIDAACRRIGRDPATLRRSLETQVLLLEHPDDWERWMAQWRGLRASAPLGAATSDLLDGSAELDEDAVTRSSRATFLIGTEEEVRGRIHDYARLGVDEIACWLMDWPDEATLRFLGRLARETA